MDIRAKAILSVMLTIATLTSVFVFMSIQQRNGHLAGAIQTKRETATFLAENMQEQVFGAYKSRIVSLATTKHDVIDAFARRDREALYRATLPFYKAITGENPYFTLMHFHLPNNSSLLRMHLPEIHGDALAEIRPIVREVNSSHKQRIGYEVGKRGLFYRVVQPVFKEGEYLGALEFGLSHEQLVSLLQQRISPEIAVAVKSESWQKVTLVGGQKIAQGEYTFLPTQNGIFGKIGESVLLAQDDTRRYTVDGKTYILFSNIELQNFQKEPIARILVALDISEELAEARTFIIKVVLLTLLLLLISSLVLYFSFGQLLTRILTLNTSLSRSNEDLTTAKAYVDNILASMSDGLLVTTADGTINKANEAFCRLLGYSEAELLEKKVFSFFENPVEVAASFASCGETHCTINKAERQLLTKEGVSVPALFSATPLADESGTLLGIVCIVTDITERIHAETALREAHDLLEQRVIERTRELAEANTALTREMAERKRAEGELRQAQKMRAIGTLAGGIAHDFNNILSAILGFSELAKLKLPEGSRAGEDIDQVISSGNRATDLVKQILSFSRKSSHQLKPLMPHLIVKEALKMMRSTLPTTVSLEEQVDSDCGSILADPTNIHQIVMNLCTNAFHAMENEKGTLAVSLCRKDIHAEDISESDVSPGPFIILSVSDTGHGMDQEAIERIFEPYFTTKEVGKGTGLGLAVIHGIVKDYKGFIQVESELGKGSIFRVHFPALEQVVSTREITEEKPLPTPTGTERILIVDDESSIVNFLKTVLERLGYTATTTTSSGEALEKIRQHPDQFDLIITDQTMPELSGVELAEEVLKIKPNMPIILCTGYSSVITEEGALAIGIRKYALKPVDRITLSNIVRQVLDDKQE